MERGSAFREEMHDIEEKLESFRESLIIGWVWRFLGADFCVSSRMAGDVLRPCQFAAIGGWYNDCLVPR